MKKSTKIIIAVVSVILVAAIVFAVLYFATDLFKTKSPKKAFHEYMKKIGENNFSDRTENLIDFQNKEFESKGKMTMDVTLGRELSDYKEVADLLNNAEISFESKVNPEDKNLYSAMNVKYDGKDLGTFELLLNEDAMGIKFDEVYDKYLTATMEELMENMNLDTTSVDDEMYNELVEIFTISNDEITRIKDRYTKILKETLPKELEDSIDEDKYSSEKQKITVNGKEINATRYTVDVSEKEIITVLNTLIKSIKEDDETLDLFVEKFNKLMVWGGESSAKITKRELVSLLDEIVDMIEESEVLDGIKIKISLYEHKDAVVRTMLSINNNQIIMDSLKDGDTTNMALKLKIQGTEMTILNIEETKKGNGKYTTKLSTDIEGYKLEITEDSEATDSNMRENVKVYIEIPNVITATLNVESELEAKSVSIDKLSSSNSVEFSSLTEADQQQLAYNILGYADKNMSVIKEIATAIGYEDEIEEFEEQLNALKSLSSSQTPTTPENDTDEAA